MLKDLQSNDTPPASRAPRSRDGLETAFRALSAHAERLEDVTISDLFDAEEGRMGQFTAAFGDLLIDFSKQDLDAAAFADLLALARASNFASRRDAMASGAVVNETEGRPALHMALRGGARLDGAPEHGSIDADVARTRAQMRSFARAVASGARAGAGGKPFSDIVNIGIGGSDLGPALVADALACADAPRAHFVSNLDGAALGPVLAELDPETTLFIVCSKTFSTLETLTNAQSAKRWIEDALGADAVGRHFAASTSNFDAARAFGVDPEMIFEFWDWVGGRFSLWSSVGLASAIAIGADAFDAMLDGAQAMDAHFLSAPLEENLPTLLALLDIWRQVARRRSGRAVAVYCEQLKLLPSYLQQLEMESNGKGVDRAGARVEERTAGVIWGGVGCDAQHAFFQMLHQGPEVIPVEFLIARRGSEAAFEEHHKLLLANCFAQSRALMTGLSEDEARAKLLAEGKGADEASALAPHLVCPGGRPSTTILFDQLDPSTLGKLLALAEHRTFAFGAMLGLNSFDQFGVELGKQIAKKIAAHMERPGALGAALDPSTRLLVRNVQ